MEDRETHQTQDPCLSHSNAPPPLSTHLVLNPSQNPPPRSQPQPKPSPSTTDTHQTLQPQLQSQQETTTTRTTKNRHKNHKTPATTTTRKHITCRSPHWSPRRSPPRRSHAITPFFSPPSRSQMYNLVVRE